MIHPPTPIKVLRAKLGPKQGTYNIFSVMRRALGPLLQPKLNPLGRFLGSRFPSSINVAFLAALVARFRITKISAKTKEKGKTARTGPSGVRCNKKTYVLQPLPTFIL